MSASVISELPASALPDGLPGSPPCELQPPIAAHTSATSAKAMIARFFMPFAFLVRLPPGNGSCEPCLMFFAVLNLDYKQLATSERAVACAHARFRIPSDLVIGRRDDEVVIAAYVHQKLKGWTCRSPQALAPQRRY